MKVLSIGMDRKLFEEGSAVLARSLLYASKMEELHIVVFSLKKHNLHFKKIGNLYLYPTNSLTRISFLFEAYLLGRKVIRDHGLVKGQAVVSAQDPMSIVGYALSKAFGLPLQLQIHADLFSPHFKNSLTTWFNFWYSGWVHIPLSKFLIPRAQGLRVVGEHIADSLRKKFPKLKASVDVLPIFVDTKMIENASVSVDVKQKFSQFSHLVFVAARLSKEKRIDVALKAMKKVVEKFPDAGLIIAGSGGEQKSLEDLLKKLGISKNVVFLGWQNDLISYYKTTDVYLLTSEFEGYGMSLIEAGAAGANIVTTSVGIAKTDLFKNGENSFVCPVGDVECLAQSLITLLSDEQKRVSFSKKMRESMQKITITEEEYVEKYVGLLEKLL